MDLEMTSLQDATKDRIIEIAVLLTDKNLRVVAEGPNLVIHADQSLFEDIPESARALHKRSGLMEEAERSTLSMRDAEAQVLAFLQEHVQPQTAPLCGNSIHMDRHFLRLQMRELDEYFFYRCIDVSTIKELSRRWAPKIYEEARARKGESAHRAMDDIKASLSELAFYQGAFFSHPT